MGPIKARRLRALRSGEAEPDAGRAPPRWITEGRVAAPGYPPARRVSLVALPASAPQPAPGRGKALTVAQPERGARC